MSCLFHSESGLETCSGEPNNKYMTEWLEKCKSIHYPLIDAAEDTEALLESLVWMGKMYGKLTSRFLCNYLSWRVFGSFLRVPCTPPTRPSHLVMKKFAGNIRTVDLFLSQLVVFKIRTLIHASDSPPKSQS